MIGTIIGIVGLTTLASARNASNQIPNVVVSAGRVIHAVLARPARSSLKPDKLRDHARAIEQVDPTRVHQRQEREIKLAAV